MKPCRVGLTRDFLRPDGSPAFGDIGLEILNSAPGIVWEFLPEAADPIRSDQLSELDGLIVLSPKVTADSLSEAQDLKIIARFGVGYDNVDVRACSDAGILLTITPDGVRRPVAAAAMAFILALAHRLPTKDRLTREGRWDSRIDYMGVGLVDRILGVIGFGNIGREVVRLARGFDLRAMAFDPYVSSNTVTDVEFVTLERLLRESDFVCITCPLTDETHHLIDAERLRLMKPTAFLINVARGPIVDQAALVDALRQEAISGAGLDSFEHEPVLPDDPLLSLHNVILAPHAAAWTDELYRNNGRSACQSVVTLLGRGIPAHIVNPEALSSARLVEWLGAVKPSRS